MVIEKPTLFSGYRAFLLFGLLMLVLLSGRLFFAYRTYSAFVSKPFYYTEAEIRSTYAKEREGRRYQVVKLQSSEGLTFFTTSTRRDLKEGRRVRIQLYPNRHISFGDYLGYFYVKSRIKRLLPQESSVKSKIRDFINSQHTDPAISSLYSAIFLATPLEKALREKIAALGISHLVALSGFHLGILWALLYGILLYGYRPLQQRFFPYRYALLDIGLVVLLFLGWYVWLVGAPPSLLRSYAMVLVGWVVILLGMELLSFTFLTTIGWVLLLLFPSLLVSWGFWLSMAGVFYIFLLLQHSSGLHSRLVSLLLIPFGIFFLMLPIVHGFFGMTTPYQLLSPLLSLLFVPFYPLAMLLHLLGVGDFLDGALLWLFALPQGGSEQHLSMILLLPYLALSLWAIWRRRAFWVLLAVAVAYAFSLFVSF